MKKKLQIWVHEKLITQKQYDAIVAYETAHTRKWGVVPFLALGALSIGLGIISIIAANWDVMGDSMKIGSVFALFVGVLALAVKLEKNHSAWFEAMLVLVCIMCGAVIGLVAQVYHLDGDFLDALKLWALAALPIVLRSKTALLSFIWLPMAGIALFDGSFVEWLINDFYDDYPIIATIVCTGVCGGVSYGARRVKYAFARAVSAWGFIGMYGAVFVGEIALAPHLSGCVLGLVFLSVMALIALKIGNARMYNFNTLLIALRILVAYIQVFGSLLTTGIGLIISGGVILGLVYGWQRFKKMGVLKMKGLKNE